MDVLKNPLPASLGAKLAAIVVHADEATSNNGRQFDAAALRAMISASDVQQFILDCGPLAPAKRQSA